MIYIRKIALLAFVILFVTNCADNDDSENNDDWHVYYSPYNSTQNLEILENDTIQLRLGDSLSIYIETPEEYPSIGIESDKDYLNIIANNNNTKYSINAKRTGIVIASVFHGLDYYFFYIDIKPFGEQYTILEEPSVEIDVENAELLSEIQNELQLSYSPKLLDSYRLIYTSFKSGLVELVNERITKDTVYGTFDINENENVNLNFPNMEFSFKIRNYEPTSQLYSHYLKQDLTNTFRNKYSSEQINNIEIVSKAVRIDIYNF